ncbi:PREDICTED: seipin-like, partial [Priapulus caudatus]|uniref:Seipin n=1 Tax=Priapulus caudatus TaxID=37621 RepID=A0ABM1F5M7_PRICU
YKPAHGAYIEVQSKHIHIYSAVLVVHAYFTGVRYILFNYPIFSAVFGISFNMTFLSMIALLSWYQFLWQRESQQVVTRIGFEASSFELRRSATRERLNRDRHSSSIRHNRSYRYDGGDSAPTTRAELVLRAAQRHAVREGMGSSEPPRSRWKRPARASGRQSPPLQEEAVSEGIGVVGSRRAAGEKRSEYKRWRRPCWCNSFCTQERDV